MNASEKLTPLIPRLVVAGTASGVKTTVVAGLIAALRQRGLVVQPFKYGPDYIDPGYHTQAAGRPCRSLDSWMPSDDQVLRPFTRACRGADSAIIEGVMGLFDGSGYDDERGSAAHIAKLLDAPVVPVLDISRTARSAAATTTTLGFARFDPSVKPAARVWTPRHNRPDTPMGHFSPATSISTSASAAPWPRASSTVSEIPQSLTLSLNPYTLSSDVSDPRHCAHRLSRRWQNDPSQSHSHRATRAKNRRDRK